MSAPYNPNIDLHVGRGGGLYLQINGRPVDNTYGAIVMAELAALREEFPAVRVDVTYRWLPDRPRPSWRGSSTLSSTATRSGTDPGRALATIPSRSRRLFGNPPSRRPHAVRPELR